MPSAKQDYTFQIPEHAIDDYRPVKIICIGAGFSGVLAGIRFPQNVKNLNLVIYEKNPNLGGTWFENRYVLNHCYIPRANKVFKDIPVWPAISQAPVSQTFLMG